MQRVAIVGAGVAGLSAAQELLKRGFAVDIYEQNAMLGGKARSFDVPVEQYQLASDCQPLPAEHGFRFFPGFYRHLMATMRAIPFPGKDSVAENLVNIDQLNYARVDRDIVSFPVGAPQGIGDIITVLKKWLSAEGMNTSVADLLRYSWRLLRFLCSSSERVLEQYEKISWWDFLQADQASEHYRRNFGNGSRILVAADPRRASSKTNGMILEQLIRDQLTGEADRVLAGPTNVTWLFPWVSALVAQTHCRIFLNAHVSEISADEASGRVTGLVLDHRDATTARFARVIACDGVSGPATESATLPVGPVTADFYICATPVEVAAQFIGEPGSWSSLANIDPGLRSLATLREHVQWMNGVMFYLKGEISTLKGHSVYVDSPYALSSIFQGRHWDNAYQLEGYGKGNLTGLCSVILSNWIDTESGQPGDVGRIPNGGRGRIYGQSASETAFNDGNFAVGKQKLIEELWEDLKASLSKDGQPLIDDSDLEFVFMDPAIRMEEGRLVNKEPLLVNRIDGWKLRPDAVTQVENFFLAGDYVQTHTDLASMEAACEAAKRAVNGILAQSDSASGHCEIYPLKRLAFFAPFRWLDTYLYRLTRKPAS